MSFKSDYSFLEKVTMGSVGTQRVIEFLTNRGHKIIELERYSTRNKIWTTKVKRLRIPDLLCLRCGQRVESRAKSKLAITMSDSPSKPDRQWDFALRDNDLVAFVYCYKNADDEWVASDIVNLYTIGDLRGAINKSVLGKPKSADEGAERDRTWPSSIPSFDAKVIDAGQHMVRCMKANGRRYTYKIRKNYYVHVKTGDLIKANASIIASVIPLKQEGYCPARDCRYNFLSDLSSDNRETVYCAVKALGFLIEDSKESIPLLIDIAHSYPDELIRLEAAGSLARLNCSSGWKILQELINQHNNLSLQMEAVLLLGELNDPRAKRLLFSIADNKGCSGELRAAAIWGLAYQYRDIIDRLITYIDDEVLDVALHAIIACSRLTNNDNLEVILNAIGTNIRRSAAIITILMLHGVSYISQIIEFVFKKANSEQRKWLIYLMGLLGPDPCFSLLEKYGKEGREIINSLTMFWDLHYNNWTIKPDISEKIRFLLKQN